VAKPLSKGVVEDIEGKKPGQDFFGLGKTTSHLLQPIHII